MSRRAPRHRLITRRDALRLAARTGAGVLVLGGIAGCGSDGDAAPTGPQAEAVARSSIAIDYASFYAPAPDLRRLTRAAAARRRVSVLFSEDPSGAAAQHTSLATLTGPRSGFRVVAVAPFDAAGLAPLVRSAGARGIAVVSLVTPIPGEAAAISLDAQDAAARLVRDLRRWARTAGRAPQILLIAPPNASPVPDPFLPYAQAAHAALGAALAAAGLRVVAGTSAVGAADAEQAVRAARRGTPGIDAVLGWNDATATGAAAALPPSGYVGALGAPAVTSAAALRAVDGDGPLRCLVAPRLSDLAAALVDVPLAVLHRTSAPSAVVALQTFSRDAAATRAARADYAGLPLLPARFSGATARNKLSNAAPPVALALSARRTSPTPSRAPGRSQPRACP